MGRQHTVLLLKRLKVDPVEEKDSSQQNQTIALYFQPSELLSDYKKLASLNLSGT